MAGEELDLYELIKGIRQDFGRVRDDPEIQRHPMFRVKEVALEVAITVSKAGSGGLRFTLPPVIPIGVEAEAKRQSEHVSKIRLVFEPLVVDETSELRDILYASPLSLPELSTLLEDVITEREKTAS